MKNRKHHGFTLVELLVTIVVLGILSGIITVSYQGITKRATENSLKSDINNAIDEINQFHLDKERYPASIASCPIPNTDSVCAASTKGNTFVYRVNNSANPPSYVLTSKNGDLMFSASSTSDDVTSGAFLVFSDSTERTGANEFLRYANVASVINQWGLIPYTISFDIKSANTANKNTIVLYMQNGSGARYSIGQPAVPVTTSYTSHKYTITPTLANASLVDSYIAFYGTYSTGNKPTVKNLKITIEN